MIGRHSHELPAEAFDGLKLPSPVQEKILTGRLTQSVTEGEELFRRLAVECGLGSFLNQSSVHPEGDVAHQGRILAQMSTTPERQCIASCLAFGSHLFDDLLDPPDQWKNRATFFAHRTNLDLYFTSQEPIARFGAALASLSINPEGVKRALARVAYNSLIIHADSDTLPSLLEEHRDLALLGVDDRVAKAFRSIDSYLYGFTSKGVQGLSESIEPSFNPTTSEIWSVIYTPALLFHDATEEINRGEVPATFFETIGLDQLSSMIRIGGEFVSAYETNPRARLAQLRDVIDTFSPFQPSEIRECYLEIERTLEALNS